MLPETLAQIAKLVLELVLLERQHMTQQQRDDERAWLKEITDWARGLLKNIPKEPKTATRKKTLVIRKRKRS